MWADSSRMCSNIMMQLRIEKYVDTFRMENSKISLVEILRNSIKIQKIFMTTSTVRSMIGVKKAMRSKKTAGIIITLFL